MNQEKFYASCSKCGCVLGRSKDGTETEIKCPKCGAEIEYRVDDDKVTIKLLRRESKSKSNKTPKTSSNNLIV